MAPFAGFGTWPTGELFSVLAAHSILRHSLGEHPAPVAADNPFFRRNGANGRLAEGGDVTVEAVSDPRRRASAGPAAGRCGGAACPGF